MNRQDQEAKQFADFMMREVKKEVKPDITTIQHCPRCDKYNHDSLFGVDNDSKAEKLAIRAKFRPNPYIKVLEIICTDCLTIYDV